MIIPIPVGEAAKKIKLKRIYLSLKNKLKLCMKIEKIIKKDIESYVQSKVEDTLIPVAFSVHSLVEKLEAIKTRKFHVTISLQVDCEHFESKEFLWQNLTDEETAKM
jgi:hypothetical protein